MRYLCLNSTTDESRNLKHGVQTEAVQAQVSHLRDHRLQAQQVDILNETNVQLQGSQMLAAHLSTVFLAVVVIAASNVSSGAETRSPL